MPLSFSVLREANKRRLPLFKNRKGEPAHSEPDGSDWLLSTWANATMGELGEVAEALEEFVQIHGYYEALGKVMRHLGKAGDIIKKVERKDVTLEEKRQALADELADVQTYLDILAFRAGIDLGEATIKKWNEVAERVGVNLRIGPNGIYEDTEMELVICKDQNCPRLPLPMVYEHKSGPRPSFLEECEVCKRCIAPKV